MFPSPPVPSQDFRFDRPRNPRGLTKEFARRARKLGFASLRFHDLRVTHETLLLDVGVPVHSPAPRLIGTPRKRTISAERWAMDDQTNQVGAGPGEAQQPQSSGAVALGRGGRMSRQRKSAAVLRLLRGEDLETVSRELGVTAATLTGWHDAFLAGGEAALTSRAATGEELESERLKAKLGAALIERDLLNEKIALLEAGRPFVRRRRTP